MAVQKDNDRLDDLIFRTINTEKLEFNAEEWKQKYPDEYQTLISRRDKRASSHRPSILRIIFCKPVVRFAVAATVIVVVGLLLNRGKRNTNIPAGNPELNIQSPTQIISMASMRMAYQQGGFDALDKQFRDTLDVLGPRSPSVSIQELIENSTMF